jgi:transcription elongation factor GreB
MNKAFVKEDETSGEEAPELEQDPRADIPAGAKNYMTPTGALMLRRELAGLLEEVRPRLIERINRSRDAAETGQDYRDLRRELRRTDRRIDFLNGRMEITEIIDPLEQRSDRVRFGATVRVWREDGTHPEYRIVGIDEADADRGRIAWTAPLARALLGSRVGDVVEVKTPSGQEEVEIAEIGYRKID